MPPSFLRMLVPAALVASAMSAPAWATETSFATFTGLGTSFVATNPGTIAGSLTLNDTSAVTFGFLDTKLTSYISNIPANLVLTATSANINYNPVFAALGVAYQTHFNGSFKITSTQAITIGSTNYAAGANLLTANFTNASFLGELGENDGALTAGSGKGSLTYTSDFLSFTNTVARDYAISLSTIVPVLTTGFDGGVPYLKSFTATPTGSFGSDPQPVSTADVPEPATWAMMLFGLGTIGLSLRTSLRRPLRTA